MMGKIYTEEEIKVNMNDAGFSDMEIRDFLKLMKQGSEKQSFRILGRHRDELLETLHKTRDSISCIDYLTYRISEGQAE